MKIWVSTVHDSCHFSYIFVGELRSVPTVALTSGLLLHTATLNALQFNSILINGFCHFPQVDCTVNSETCGRFGVNGYPTLKIFHNGEDFAAYDGPRSAGGYFKIIAVLVCVLCFSVCMTHLMLSHVPIDGIVSYMKKQAGPSSIPLHNGRDLDAFVNNFDASVVGEFTFINHSQVEIL